MQQDPNPGGSPQQAGEDQVDATYTQAVPRRPSHGASGSELVLLRIALELAPGGLLGDGLPGLDDANTSAVLTAVAELADGRYLKPDWADL